MQNIFAIRGVLGMERHISFYPLGSHVKAVHFLISFSGATLGFGFNVWFQEELEYAIPEGNTRAKNAKVQKKGPFFIFTCCFPPLNLKEFSQNFSKVIFICFRRKCNPRRFDMLRYIFALQFHAP